MGFFKSIWNFIKSAFLILGLILLLVGGIVLSVFIFNGKIYIELIILGIIFYMFLFWKIWFNYSKKKLIKNYDPEKDKARKGEVQIYDGKTKTKGGEQCKSIGGRKVISIARAKSNIDATSEDVVGYERPKGSELLQTTKTNDDGKTSRSNRKNGRGIRKLLGRRRRI